MKHYKNILLALPRIVYMTIFLVAALGVYKSRKESKLEKETLEQNDTIFEKDNQSMNYIPKNNYINNYNNS